MTKIIDSAFALRMRGFGTLTTEITYRMPDYRNILQLFILQRDDIAPDFPELKKFLDWWDRNIDGPIHSVRFANMRLITANDVRVIGTEYRLN